MPTRPAAPVIDPALSVNDTLRRWPTSVGALNALGVDSCCGGAASLASAAAEAGVPLDALLAAVARAAEEGA